MQVNSAFTTGIGRQTHLVLPFRWKHMTCWRYSIHHLQVIVILCIFVTFIYLIPDASRCHSAKCCNHTVRFYSQRQENTVVDVKTTWNTPATIFMRTFCLTTWWRNFIVIQTYDFLILFSLDVFLRLIAPMITSMISNIKTSPEQTPIMIHVVLDDGTRTRFEAITNLAVVNCCDARTAPPLVLSSRTQIVLSPVWCLSLAMIRGIDPFHCPSRKEIFPVDGHINLWWFDWLLCRDQWTSMSPDEPLDRLTGNSISWTPDCRTTLISPLASYTEEIKTIRTVPGLWHAIIEDWVPVFWLAELVTGFSRCLPSIKD